MVDVGDNDQSGKEAKKLTGGLAEQKDAGNFPNDFARSEADQRLLDLGKRTALGSRDVLAQAGAKKEVREETKPDDAKQEIPRTLDQMKEVTEKAQKQYEDMVKKTPQSGKGRWAKAPEDMRVTHQYFFALAEEYEAISEAEWKENKANPDAPQNFNRSRRRSDLFKTMDSLAHRSADTIHWLHEAFGETKKSLSELQSATEGAGKEWKKTVKDRDSITDSKNWAKHVPEDIAATTRYAYAVAEEAAARLLQSDEQKAFDQRLGDLLNILPVLSIRTKDNAWSLRIAFREKMNAFERKSTWQKIESAMKPSDK
ncbi:MAG: hypothetical protein Greene101449_527 [Candidatus Peregrinibacteria bacterium Greene1014_49]|nr:MAG: hypothetical protein Greene101449_527 [Candidatus Peregrinibacteria bacterium Greene1014_49]